MPPPYRIVIYGNSISLAGIAVNCFNRPGFEIVSIDADDADAARQLQAAAPDVVIFDLTARAEAAIALLKSLPHVVCIGVDPASDQVLLLSGQHATALSIKDLVELIRRQEPRSAAPLESP